MSQSSDAEEVFAGVPAVGGCIVDLVAGSAPEAGREMVAVDRAMGSAEIGKRMLILSSVMPTALWAFGLAASLVRGCDPESAQPRATAYALSWLAGWLVYCGVPGRPRSREDLGSGYRCLATGLGMVNSTMLEPKARSWPCREMLRFGVLSSIGFALVMGLAWRVGTHARQRATPGEASTPPEPGR